MIRNKIQLILDSLQDEELERVYYSLQFVQKKYLFRKRMNEKGVEISELFLEEAELIIDLWDKTFTQNIPDELKEVIHYSQYKWHIFSYEQQDCMKDVAARRAFNHEVKDELYVMYQNKPDVLVYSNAGSVIAEDFDQEQDIYIFDRSLSWTYVNTHESMCGPYFYKLK
ncbi:DUF4275 family protein [Paenibacillus sp. Marseille-Q7038]